MPKYINADELMQKIYEHHYILRSFDNSKDFGLFDIGIKRVVDEMPAADVVEVKHGEWGEKLWWHICSQCGYNYCHTDDDGERQAKNFCPNCGADMRGETE